MKQGIPRGRWLISASIVASQVEAKHHSFFNHTDQRQVLYPQVGELFHGSRAIQFAYSKGRATVSSSEKPWCLSRLSSSIERLRRSLIERPTLHA